MVQNFMCLKDFWRVKLKCQYCGSTNVVQAPKTYEYVCTNCATVLSKGYSTHRNFLKQVVIKKPPKPKPRGGSEVRTVTIERLIRAYVSQQQDTNLQEVFHTFRQYRKKFGIRGRGGAKMYILAVLAIVRERRGYDMRIKELEAFYEIQNLEHFVNKIKVLI